jgi:hypothetical protein
MQKSKVTTFYYVFIAFYYFINCINTCYPIGNSEYKLDILLDLSTYHLYSCKEA